MSTEEKRYGLDDLEKRLGKATFGDFLRTWRLTGEFTLKGLSRKVGMSIQNLSDIEKGRKGVSPEKAEKIAKSLGVPPAYLIGLALQDQLETVGLHTYRVEVHPAA